MKKLIISLLASLILVPAVQAQEPASAEKEIVIIKKHIDENGVEVVEKKVIKGEDAENFEWKEEMPANHPDDVKHIKIVEIQSGEEDEQNLIFIRKVGEEINVDVKGAGEHEFLWIGDEHGEQEYEVEVEIDAEGEVHREIIIRKQKGEAFSRDNKPEVEWSDEQYNQPLSLTGFTVFPNPSSGAIQLQFEGEAVPTKILITDVIGRSVYEENLSSFSGQYNRQLEIEGERGTYFVSVIQGSKVLTEKVIRSE
ncbi:MAG: T9SS type A sorting domain-containing protein [Bacteroidetes bacterium]|nr:T9SS type A sorting domain-containing protein [Bacteroidota bacterium]